MREVRKHRNVSSVISANDVDGINIKHVISMENIVAYFVAIPLYRPKSNPMDDLLIWFLTQYERTVEYVSELKLSLSNYIMFM